MGEIQQPIGVFDSGVGGLSVLRAIVQLMPQQDVVYYADQAHVPYGARSAENIRHYCHTITQFLLDQGCRLIVIACNTASAAALTYLRAQFPDVPFVGMEPAVKPGAEATRSGVVGVLATAGTFRSQRYESLMERFAQNVRLLEDDCRGLVPLIEQGGIDSAETHALLQSIVRPMLAQGADTLVLGCTHYPFVQAQIAALAGEGVVIIDPSPAVARQVERVIGGLVSSNQWSVSSEVGSVGRLIAYTSGDPARFALQAGVLTDLSFEMIAHHAHLTAVNN